MRLGIQETSLGLQTPQDNWRLCKQAGVEGLNLCYPVPPDTDAFNSAEYTKQIANLSKRNKVAVSGMHLGFLSDMPFLVGDADKCQVARNLIRRAIGVAAILDAPVVILPLVGPNGIRTTQHQESAVTYLRSLSDATHKSGVSIAVEGPMGYEQVRDLLTAIDRDNVKFCFDTADAAIEHHDSIGMIRNLGADRIAQVHFRDVNLSTQPPDYSLRLGRGDVRFDAVMFALRSVMYDGWVILETPPGDSDGQIVSLHVEDARNILTAGLKDDSTDRQSAGYAAS